MGKQITNIVIICGPTASGKTKLALQLAKELGSADILSVDSRQVYQELDIITGKDIPANLPPDTTFFGTDLFKPNEIANLADFTRYSQNVISNSIECHKPLIIVGGTGLYLKSITQNLSQISVPPNYDLRAGLEKMSLQELQEELKKINPEKLFSLNHSDSMNPRRLIRQIEISHASPQESPSSSRLNNLKFHWIGLCLTKEDLENKIRSRVIARLEAGAIEEVKNLLKKYSDFSLPLFSSLGVSQIISFLNKQITQDELINLWSKAEVDYARRQMVWFKKQPDIVWYDKNSDKLDLVTKLRKIYINNA